MDLLQWIIPEPGGGFASLLAPAGFEELKLLDEEGERPAGVYRRGPLLESELLPYPLTIAFDRPADAGRAPFEPERLRLRLHLTPDAPSSEAGVAPAGEDDLGVVSLLSEYLRALASIVDELRMPLRFIAPSAGGGVDLEVGPLLDDRDAPVVERLLLLRAAADLLARARGFRVAAADTRLPGGGWAAVNAALRQDLPGGSA